jgi:hypothetical protein
VPRSRSPSATPGCSGGTGSPGRYPLREAAAANVSTLLVVAMLLAAALVPAVLTSSPFGLEAGVVPAWPPQLGEVVPDQAGVAVTARQIASRRAITYAEERWLTSFQVTMPSTTGAHTSGWEQ